MKSLNRQIVAENACERQILLEFCVRLCAAPVYCHGLRANLSCKELAMIVGVPREVKADEYRVGMIPAGVKVLSNAGHQVLVEANAGVGSGIADEEYLNVGA